MLAVALAFAAAWTFASQDEWPETPARICHGREVGECGAEGRPGELHVEWQLREVNGTFHRLPPKDDSYRSPDWEPGLPADLPPFLDKLLTSQIQDCPHRRCAAAAASTCG